MSFYKTQDLIETFNFNLIRSSMLSNFENIKLKFINLNGDNKRK